MDLRVLSALAIATILWICNPCLGDNSWKCERQGYDVWLGVYMSGVKVGYRHAQVEHGLLNGRPGHCFRLAMHYRYTSGAVLLETTDASSYFVDSSYAPVYAESCITSSLGPKTHTLAVRGTCRDGRIDWLMVKDGKESHSQTIIPSVRPVQEYWKVLMGARKLRPGDNLDCAYLSMSDTGIVATKLHVLRREKLQALGRSFDALVVEWRYGGTLTTWHSDDGMMLKFDFEDAPHNVCIAEPMETALSGWVNPTKDIDCVDTLGAVPDPEHATDLTVRLSLLAGLELPGDDNRQTCRRLGSSQEADCHVVARRSDPQRSIPLTDARRSGVGYLTPSPGIEANAKEISDMAGSIAGDETNAYLAAQKLQAWVHGTIRFDYQTETHMSALAALQSRSGVCRHAAVLYTALARSVGIPTRLLSGLVYHGDGFSHHVWAESYVGEWVQVDPTWGNEFVDATHVKLASGEIRDIEKPMRFIPLLRATVLSCR